MADAETLYLFDDCPPHELMSDLKPLDYLGVDLLDKVAQILDSTARLRLQAADLLYERQWLVVGPAGSGCRWHVDPFETSAWNVLLHGQKLWCIFIPRGQQASHAAMAPCKVDDAGGKSECELHAFRSLRVFLSMEATSNSYHLCRCCLSVKWRVSGGSARREPSSMRRKAGWARGDPCFNRMVSKLSLP